MQLQEVHKASQSVKIAASAPQFVQRAVTAAVSTLSSSSKHIIKDRTSRDVGEAGGE
jgi:hypothetical protein